MDVCILEQQGTKLVHKNLSTTPETFLRTVAPYRDDLIVGVACRFTWYWLGDLCSKEEITFVLGHALYMKAIHGGKAKNDEIDAPKIAVLLRGGRFPQAKVYPSRDAGDAGLTAAAGSFGAQARGTAQPKCSICCINCSTSLIRAR